MADPAPRDFLPVSRFAPDLRGPGRRSAQRKFGAVAVSQDRDSVCLHAEARSDFAKQNRETAREASDRTEQKRLRLLPVRSCEVRARWLVPERGQLLLRIKRATCLRSRLSEDRVATERDHAEHDLK